MGVRFGALRRFLIWSDQHRRVFKAVGVEAVIRDRGEVRAQDPV